MDASCKATKLSSKAMLHFEPKAFGNELAHPIELQRSLVSRQALGLFNGRCENFPGGRQRATGIVRLIDQILVVLPTKMGN